MREITVSTPVRMWQSALLAENNCPFSICYREEDLCVLEHSPRCFVIIAPVAGCQIADGESILGRRIMNKLAAADVDADMINRRAACGEEDKVSFFQVAFADVLSDFFLISGPPGKRNAVFLEDVFGEGGTVEYEPGWVSDSVCIGNFADQAFRKIDNAVGFA